ncbi:metallo-beta-lactamase family protein [Biscogniauxia mediterranea]|nr:metallo-beta-lactamase family protein [Biscogniauxia mediterranea]
MMAAPCSGPLPSSPNDDTGSWLICTACGTQFPTSDPAAQQTCFICDDPRQFAPPTGQSFTTLDALRAPGSGYKNEFTPLLPINSNNPSSSPSPSSSNDDDTETFTSIHTTPRFAIGQRAILVRTPRGNILWDCLTLLDAATVAEIASRGGLAAIVISHPHYYTTHLEWSRAFSCPVYLAAEDARWLAQRPAPSSQQSPQQIFVPETETEYDVPVGGAPSGFTVLKLGGHFPGSGVGLYRGRLLVADTLVTTPSGVGGYGRRGQRPRGMNSYAFMWSIPNMIPLAPADLARMWGVLRRHEFRSTHGAFPGLDIVGADGAEMKRRVLESMQIQIRHSGHEDHALLKETVA